MIKSINEPSSDAHVKKNRDLGRAKGEGGKSALLTRSFGSVIDS